MVAGGYVYGRWSLCLWYVEFMVGGAYVYGGWSLSL